MTITLRPESQETPTAAGGRTRRWQICVNGRPVGGLRTTAVPRGDRVWGEIAELEVRSGRGRGRGTIAALAAEEVLRGWGCVRVDADIPETARIARSLAVTLGYTERMRNMIKRLDGPPALPGGVAARPIDEDAFPAWLAEAKAGYVSDLLASGLGEEQARAKAEADHLKLLPQGAGTPGVALRRLHGAGEEPLGSLWLALRVRELSDGAPLGWVMVVEVADAHRGRGHGRTLMRLAERECLAAGVRDLGLNVFSGNEVAVRLYDSLGYRVTNRVYGKQLL
ncbi:GNAT family N-acetyltransferase [Kitasatospora purpeofusca]|uniref:GNAT family N-acetyltransferase n=1 Tax=Kitasatospora purpeofusca TaxID=67352 RepID=UPI002253E358|nr:GNAT family N-acetyltransferase [Kitasatospora purpeofusca]MCX4758153.1 GNAT family N-acetyltransferase [Kitasatospora purpeofusca]WSR31378.1 GNAT family N-acetyltransferase [Kitasatospora purpeofusca]WSR39401.1 GNAT family N-acetyltransferase [Kitasatospora purpeofusca]